MPCLNAIAGLNPLEQFIVQSIPDTARHVAVVRAGDGRLARAVRATLSADAEVCVVESRPELHAYLDDFDAAQVSTGYELDPSWYQAKVAERGLPFDWIIFYNLHEYWGGHTASFYQILQTLAPKGSCWVNYLNATCVPILQKRLASGSHGSLQLGDPLNAAPQFDLGAWAAFLNTSGFLLEQLWGALEPVSYAFLGNKAKTPTELRLGNLALPVANATDAFALGGMVHALQFRRRQEIELERQPRVNACQLNGLTVQSFLLPYPDLDEQQQNHFQTLREIAAWQSENHPPFSPTMTAFLGELARLGDVQRVLYVGSGWGRDLLLLSQWKTDWEWTGIESDAFAVEQGSHALASEALNLHHFDPAAPLPFEDGAFDLVITTGYFSRIHLPLARQLLPELIRVASKHLCHLEDSRGPDLSIYTKLVPLPMLYQQSGRKAHAQPLLVNNQPSGVYVLQCAL